MLKFINRLLLTIFLFTSIQLALNAQSDWLDGFIVKLDGDTVKGKVGYQTSDLQFSKCIFKQGNNVREYSSGDIAGYGIDNIKTYHSGIVEQQFAEVIAIGPLSLFKQRRTLLIRTEDGEVYPLSSKTKTVRRDGSDYVSEGQKWKSILFGILSSCQISSDEIKNLNFNEKNILHLVKEFNDCKNQSTKAYSNRGLRKTIIDFGIQIGSRNNELNVSSSDGVPRPIDTNHKSSNLILGAFVNFRFPNFSEKISLQAGINYQAVDLIGVSNFSNANNPFRTSLIIDRYDISSSFTSIGIPISLKGLLVDGAVSVYVQTGVTLNKVFNTSSSIKRTRTINNGSPSTVEEAGGLIFREGGSDFWGRVGITKSINGKYKIGIAFDLSILSNNSLLSNTNKFFPFNQSGFSLFLSR